MLKHLSISNYVLIDSLDVSFTDGLSIITGETGAGKSILLGALGLVLGERADSKALANKKSKCIIEAEFEISNYQLEKFFSENDLDYEASTIIRREISADGKSRAFVNDTPVNLSVLKELSSRLIDIHSQHQTLTVNNSLFQLSVIDLYAKHEKLLNEYKSEYNQYVKLGNVYNELVDKENKGKAELDYIQFQFDELEKANVVVDEKESLEKELELLNHTESIINSLSGVGMHISDGENNALQSVSQATVALQNVSKYHDSINEVAKRLQSCKVELKDIASEISTLQNHFNFNPDRAVIVGDRLNLLNHLEQKHRVKGNELIEVKNTLQQRLNDFSSIEDKIKDTLNKLNNCKAQLQKLAGTLSDNRKKAGDVFQTAVAKLLVGVELKDAKLAVDIMQKPHLTPTGIDEIKFLFSANKGSALQELSKVASGGEMSRLMLCIKSVIAKLTALPTILFDEIDTGISGEVAFKVGALIENISTTMQVIAITHLPQMAGKGKSHYLVYKETKNNSTKSYIKLLSKDERIVEIAKMISGKSLTDASMESAKELLQK